MSKLRVSFCAGLVAAAASATIAAAPSYTATPLGTIGGNGSSATAINASGSPLQHGQGGAPAHRYTTSLSVRSQMLAQGWISEGYGDNSVIMCAPI